MQEFLYFSDVGRGTRGSSATHAFVTLDVCTARARSPGSVIVWRAGEDSFVTKVTITSHSNQPHNAITDNKITRFHSNLSANITSQLQLQYFSRVFITIKSVARLSRRGMAISKPEQTHTLISPMFTVSPSQMICTIVPKLASCTAVFGDN